MPRNLSLTLAGANKELSAYLKSFFVKANEKTFLTRLQNQIRAIHTAQSGWLKVGLLADARAAEKDLMKTYKKETLTQQALIEEAAKAYQNMLGFTQTMLSALFSTVEIELKKNKQRLAYAKTLSDIHACLIALQEDAKKYSQDEKIKREERKFFSLDNPRVQQIHHSGGRFLPFCQIYDPLKGSFRRGIKDVGFQGVCAGHVKDWGEQIKKQGRVTQTFSLNSQTYHYQEKSIASYNRTKIFRYNLQSDFNALIRDILKNVSEKNSYDLSITFHNGGVSHALGIRRLPGHQGFELFDPDFGVVVFDKEDIFQSWLANYLCEYCAMIGVQCRGPIAGHFTLSTINAQPKDSLPSIPHLAEQHPKKKRPVNFRDSVSIVDILNDYAGTVTHPESLDLAQRDNEVRRSLFRAMYQSIYDYQQDQKLPPASHQQTSVVNHYLNNSIPPITSVLDPLKESMSMIWKSVSQTISLITGGLKKIMKNMNAAIAKIKPTLKYRDVFTEIVKKEAALLDEPFPPRHLKQYNKLKRSPKLGQLKEPLLPPSLKHASNSRLFKQPFVAEGRERHFLKRARSNKMKGN